MVRVPDQTPTTWRSAPGTAVFGGSGPTIFPPGTRRFDPEAAIAFLGVVPSYHPVLLLSATTASDAKTVERVSAAHQANFARFYFLAVVLAER